MTVCIFALLPFGLIAKSYLSQDSFVSLTSQSLENPVWKTKTLWLDKSIQAELKNILSHPYPKLRLRYKISTNQPIESTIWFLDEIGKERPISFAISIKENQIQLIRVLEFRESRGYEIHMHAFTEQFNQVSVSGAGRLNQSIDGITGATMSVNAMKKIARVALFLHTIALSK